MDYINFYVALPQNAYIRLENQAKKMKQTRNEFILNAILSQITNEDKLFNPLKNAQN